MSDLQVFPHGEPPAAAQPATDARQQAQDLADEFIEKFPAYLAPDANVLGAWFHAAMQMGAQIVTATPLSQSANCATAELLAALDELYPLADDEQRTERAGRTAFALKRWMQMERQIPEMEIRADVAHEFIAGLSECLDNIDVRFPADGDDEIVRETTCAMRRWIDKLKAAMVNVQSGAAVAPAAALSPTPPTILSEWWTWCNEHPHALDTVAKRPAAVIEALWVEICQRRSPLLVALQTVEAHLDGCGCDHSTADCCALVGEWCARCFAAKALREAGYGLVREVWTTKVGQSSVSGVRSLEQSSSGPLVNPFASRDPDRASSAIGAAANVSSAQEKVTPGSAALSPSEEPKK